MIAHSCESFPAIEIEVIDFHWTRRILERVIFDSTGPSLFLSKRISTMIKFQPLALFLLAFPTLCWAQLTGEFRVRSAIQETEGSTIRFADEAENPEFENEPEFEEEEENDEIETDRDSFTPTTNVVGCGRIVFESAYSFIDNRDVAETHSFPEMLTRYGISDNIELRLGWNYEIGGAGNPISGNNGGNDEESAEVEKESRIIYGAKFSLSEQCNWKPESAFIVQGYTPTSGESSYSSISTTYVAGWKLPKNWTLDNALRYSTSRFEEDHFNVWAPSTVIKIPIGERWKAHAEYFGVFSDGREDETVQNFFSPGMHYLINRDVEIGIRVGWGLNREAPNFFCNVGGGWRF